MRYVVWIAALVLTSLVGCQTVETTERGLVGIDRKQTMSPLVPADAFNKAAADEYQKVLQAMNKKGQLNRDPAQVERVRRIAKRLIPNTSAFRADAPGWAWEVNVISSDEVNAWCMPGGKIAVYTGLLAKLNPTDDELAAVMGHEISHALREHSREQASHQAAQGLLINLVGAATGYGGLVQDLGPAVLDVMFNLPHSRTDETEADRMGVELAARAGFDPHASVSLWQKMGKLGGGKPPEWLSTHPSDERRTRDLQNYSERVMPLYEAARKR
ncbi:MAG TPA: M48 family metallopeptidase [Burkholderiales bacterium]|nr:M48 family metallopeptidase [Burkholderiales bacterium]